MSNQMKIDPETCSRCGLCASICPALAIDQDEKSFPPATPIMRRSASAAASV